MAEEQSAPGRAGEHAGNFLKKKVGPLPVWGWAAVGGAVVFFVLSRRRAAASAPGGAVGPGTVASGQVPTGYGSTTDSQLSNLSAQLSGIQSALSPTADTFEPTDTSAFKLSGSGYTGDPGSPTANIVTRQGIFSWLTSWNQVQAALGSGQNVYYQEAPGNFASLGASPDFSKIAPGTPLFLQVPNPYKTVTPQMVSSLATTSGPVAPVGAPA